MIKQLDICLKMRKGMIVIMSILAIVTVMLDFAVKLFTLGALILAIRALKIYINKHQ